jgi:toxin YoeB
MRGIAFTSDAFADYNEWATENKQIFKRIVSIVTDCQRDPFRGIGKPELLKHQLKGCWSRRITDEHRLVYQVTNDYIIIISCKYHY